MEFSRTVSMTCCACFVVKKQSRLMMCSQFLRSMFDLAPTRICRNTSSVGFATASASVGTPWRGWYVSVITPDSGRFHGLAASPPSNSPSSARPRSPSAWTAPSRSRCTVMRSPLRAAMSYSALATASSYGRAMSSTYGRALGRLTSTAPSSASNVQSRIETKHLRARRGGGT